MTPIHSGDCCTEIILAEIVTYDPVRRKGFLRVIDRPWPGRIFFALRELRGPLKDQIVEASRELNRAKKNRDSPDAFESALKGIKRIVVGQRIPVEIRYSPQSSFCRAVSVAA